MDGVFSSCLYCLYTVKHPAGRPRPEGLDCFTTSRRSEVDRGEKWCISHSLFPSLSRSLFNTVLKLPILERAGPREFELPTSSSSSSSSGAFVVFFVSHLYTRAHEFQCDDLARRWCLFYYLKVG